MSRPNKKHHKIPATYLHGFTDSGGHLWVADRNYKIYPAKPETVLSESDYYTVRFPSGGGTLVVETKYLNGIEGNYATIFEKIIKNKEPVDLETKAQLSVFVASMFERQPSKRDSLQKFFSDVKEKVEHMRALSPETKRRLAKIPSITSGKGIPADEFLEMGKDVGSLHTSMIPEGVDVIAPIIFDMKWAFVVRSEGESPFMTSDNPCSLANPVLEATYGPGIFGSTPGFAQKDVELSLPLSSDIALFCGWRLEMDCQYIPIDEKFINDMNRRVRRGAKVVICSEKNELDEMIRKAKEFMTNKK